MNQKRELNNMTNFTNETIKTTLAEGYSVVTFTKKTGEVAIRRVTRDPKIMPAFIPKTDQVRTQSEKTVRTWDGDNNKFVSIIAENVISITK
jgi:hypothetical protein